MSAAVCGKRSFFEDSSASSPVGGGPVSKKIRWSSPVRLSSSPFSPPPLPRNSILERLREAFPHMDLELLDKVLDESADDIDAAIKRLHELHIGSSEVNSAPVAEPEKNTAEDGGDANGAVTPENPVNRNTLPADGAEWVEWFVREMTNATSLDDARARAATLLELLEKSISSRARVEAVETYQKVVHFREHSVLKEQNTILKQAVVIQHERQKEYEGMGQELQHLKQLVPQYQEQLRNLEVTNYTLRMHLKQAQQSSSIPGRFHPDVF
ncbi:hypothetical protein AKJ16_DCAP14543 [Drosera capensis]